MNKYLKSLCLFSSFAIAAILVSCGGGGGGSSTRQGTLNVSMTDTPACGFDEVNVTVNKVRVHQSASAAPNDSGWSEIVLNPARKINLLTLTNGVLEDLGQVPLPAGHYTQLRLVLDPNTGNGFANSVVLTGTTTEISLSTPSAVHSGIKLINEFDVVADQRVDLVLDFNACKSVVKKGNGNFALKPVIKVIPTVENGIDGFVNPALLGSNVMVSAQQNGVIVNSTVPNANGEFFLARLAPGNYDVVFTADNFATSVIATVPVASTTSVVAVSTSLAPINLVAAATVPHSIGGTIILNPSSDLEVGYAAALQTFASGPTVTVKFQGGDADTGAYTIANLPTVAPQLGQYSATLPIVFAAQSNTTPGTGKYAVSATAEGYTSQAVLSVDVTSANQSGINFTLTP
jgi:hypothetical protein